MHFDAGEAGVAQRYFLLGLRAARAASDEACAANIMGMLAYQAAHSAQPREAVRLAEAAMSAAQKLDVSTRARIAGRLATAHAASGDVYAFRVRVRDARSLWERRDDGGPAFLYYFTGEQLAAESGQALVDLARANPDRKQALLAEAVELLTPLSSAGLGSTFSARRCCTAVTSRRRTCSAGDLEGACGAHDRVRGCLVSSPDAAPSICSGCGVRS